MQAAFAGGGEDAGDQRLTDAAALHGGVGLGVREGRGAVLDVVAGEAEDLVTEPHLEASPIRDVDHDRLRAAVPPLLPPAPLPGFDIRPEGVEPRRSRAVSPRPGKPTWSGQR